jgi:hypothetical protein
MMMPIENDMVLPRKITGLNFVHDLLDSGLLANYVSESSRRCTEYLVL